MKRLTMLLLVALLALAGCGKSSSSNNSSSATPPSAAAQSSNPSAPATDTTATTPPAKTSFAKTKFVFHAGLAFGAFHRYIYKPFKAGRFSGSILSNKLPKVKGALAALFAYREIRLALDDARSSKILSKLLSPLLALQTKLSSLKSGLKHGDASQVAGANADVTNISSLSQAAGQPVKDLPTPQLGG